MARNGAPARPWYEEVVATIAVRGWTKAELADRSGVARTTIDNWERNPRKPQAKSVNAVADVLGIPREQALRLAGVLGGAAEGDTGPPVPPELAGHPTLVDQIRQQYPDPEDQARLMREIAATLRGDPPPTTPASEDRSRPGERERRAG